MFVIMKINILILSSDSKEPKQVKINYTFTIGYGMIDSKFDKINYVVFSSFSDPSCLKNLNVDSWDSDLGSQLEVIVVEGSVSTPHPPKKKRI